MSHWSVIAESGTVIGMRILLVIYQLLGRWAFRLVLYPVMMYYYLLRSDARAASNDYLMRIRPHLKPPQPNLSSYEHFMAFGEALLDKLLVWMGEINADTVDFEIDAAFHVAQSQKKGGIIVVSHLGNTEVCHAIAHQQPDLKMNVLVYTQHAKKFNALMERFHDAKQIELIQVTEMTPAFAMKMSARIEAGEFIAIAGDRTPVTGDKRTSVVDFFDATAAMPQGAFILAALLKCPVFTLFCLKKKARYTIHLEHFADVVNLPRKTRETSLQTYVQAYANRLAHYCLQTPMQWFNFYQFWQDAKKGENGSIRS